MERIRKIRALVNRSAATRLAVLSANIILQLIVCIVLFNLLGQGLIAHAVSAIYFFGMIAVFDEVIKEDLS